MNKRLVATLVLILILSGCSADNITSDIHSESTESQSEAPFSFSVSSDQLEPESISEPDNDDCSEESSSTPQKPDVSGNSASGTSTQPPANSQEPKKPAEYIPPTTTPTPPPQTVTLDPTPPPAPAPTPTPAPQPAPEPTPEPTPSPPTVDIGYYVQFAMNYGASIGLNLDGTATGCWDNPISVSAGNTTVEQSIMDRLNRYRNVEGFTAIWAWSEDLGGGRYNLYIGYA